MSEYRFWKYLGSIVSVVRWLPLGACATFEAGILVGLFAAAPPAKPLLGAIFALNTALLLAMVRIVWRELKNKSGGG